MTDMNENGCPVLDDFGDNSPTDKETITRDVAGEEASAFFALLQNAYNDQCAAWPIQFHGRNDTRRGLARAYKEIAVNASGNVRSVVKWDVRDKLTVAFIREGKWAILQIIRPRWTDEKLDGWSTSGGVRIADGAEAECVAWIRTEMSVVERSYQESGEIFSNSILLRNPAPIEGMTEDEWEAKFVPLTRIDHDHPEFGNDGDDGAFLDLIGDSRIWTRVKTASAFSYVPGRRSENSLGYMVTMNPWAGADAALEISIELDREAAWDSAGDGKLSAMTDDEWWDEFEAERYDEMREVEDQPDEMVWTQFSSGGVIQYVPGCQEGGDGYYVGIKPWGPEHADLVITVDDDDLRALGGYL